MIQKVGLWIDHQKAIVVTMLENGEEITEMKSEVEKEVEILASDRRQSSFSEHLNIYRDALIASMGYTVSILVFGLGEAKDEFEKRLEKDEQLCNRIVDVLTADKIIDNQIAAKVREYFRDNHIR